MLDTTITHHSNLPEHLRESHGYAYLMSHHLSYWRHAVDVAHQLLDAHAAKQDDRCYYQDEFRDDFMRAVQQTDLSPESEVLGPFTLNMNLRNEEKITDPQWIAYREARQALVAGPRGTALVFKSVYDGGEHWEANAHQGGGNITNCSTMPRGMQAATRDAIWENIISYECYLARKQAEQEKLILANYARIRELKLSRGMLLQDVAIFFDGKYRNMRFVISSIDDTGKLKLSHGKMKGSSKVFEATTDAVTLKAENIAPLPEKAQRIAPVDDHSLALF